METIRVYRTFPWQEIASIKFGREWGYFYLLSGTETGISFDGIRVLVLYKRFLSHVSPSVARLPLLVSDIGSAIIIVNLFFFLSLFSLHKSYLV